MHSQSVEEWLHAGPVFWDAHDIQTLRKISIDCMQFLCAHSDGGVYDWLYEVRDRAVTYLDKSNARGLHTVLRLEHVIRGYAPSDKQPLLLDINKLKRKALLKKIIDIENFLSKQKQNFHNPATTLKYISEFQVALRNLKQEIPETNPHQTFVSLQTLIAQHIETVKANNKSNTLRVTVGVSKTYNYLPAIENVLYQFNKLCEHEKTAFEAQSKENVSPLVKAEFVPPPFEVNDILEMRELNLNSMRAVCRTPNVHIPGANYEFRDADQSRHKPVFLRKHLCHLEKQSRSLSLQMPDEYFARFKTKLFTAFLIKHIDEAKSLVEKHLNINKNEVVRGHLQQLIEKLMSFKTMYSYADNPTKTIRDYYLRLSYLNVLLESSNDVFNARLNAAHHSSCSVRKFLGSSKTENYLGEMKTMIKGNQKELSSIPLKPQDNYFCINEQTRNELLGMVANYKNIARLRERLRERSAIAGLFHHDLLSNLNKEINRKIEDSVVGDNAASIEEKAGLYSYLKTCKQKINILRKSYANTDEVWSGFYDWSEFWGKLSFATFGVAAVVGIPLIIGGLFVTVAASIGIHAVAPGKGKLLQGIDRVKEGMSAEFKSAIWDVHAAPSLRLE